MANKNQGPAVNNGKPAQSPASSTGANIASKTTGSYGQTPEGNVSGKGPNKAR